MLKILHLFPNQLGLNGEAGNVECLLQRLRWSGIEADSVEFSGVGQIPTDIDGVFIGSGTLAGALEALTQLRQSADDLKALAADEVPFLALGLGWEILGESIEFVDGSKVQGLGIYASSSRRVSNRASAESFGFDDEGNLTAGYANHSAEISLHGSAKPLVMLSKGFGNSSIHPAEKVSGEGLIQNNLMAARLNGPILPMNPHLADRFIRMMAKRSNFDYQSKSQEASIADGYSIQARTELKKRLLS